MTARDPQTADELLAAWARLSDRPAPPPPTGRRNRGLGPVLAVALGLLVLAVVARTWPMAPTPSGSPPASATQAGAPTPLPATPSPTPPPSEPPSPSPSSPPPSATENADAALARTLAAAYETARAGGDFARAWAMLAPTSQAAIGSLTRYAELEAAYNAAGGTSFEVGDPTRDPALFGPDFLGQAYLDVAATADLERAWLVFVDHPAVRGASAGTRALLIAPVGERWFIWLAR